MTTMAMITAGSPAPMIATSRIESSTGGNAIQMSTSRDTTPSTIPRYQPARSPSVEPRIAASVAATIATVSATRAP